MMTRKRRIEIFIPLAPLKKRPQTHGGVFFGKYLNDNGIAIKNSTQNFPFGVSFIVGHSHYHYYRFQHKPHFISGEKTLDDVKWRGGRKYNFRHLLFKYSRNYTAGGKSLR